MTARRKGKRVRKVILASLVCSTLCVGAWLLWRYHGPAPAQEIFHGITYGCERLPETDESGGLYHWVRADLNVPGVSLYATPKNSEATANGFEYKLHYVSSVVADNHLAAAVNGTLFAVEPSGLPLPGDYANSLETIVADHAVNHVDPNSYLMWWDDNMRGHLERWKPPPPAALRAAKWGIAGQEPILLPPTVRADDPATDQRTVIAADPEKKLVWIACFDKASYHFISYFMEARGAKIIIAVDGGSSMAMAIGSGAKNVRSGTITGNWKPVATEFGFRAEELR